MIKITQLNGIDYGFADQTIITIIQYIDNVPELKYAGKYEYKCEYCKPELIKCVAAPDANQ